MNYCIAFFLIKNPHSAKHKLNILFFIKFITNGSGHYLKNNLSEPNYTWCVAIIIGIWTV